MAIVANNIMTQLTILIFYAKVFPNVTDHVFFPNVTWLIQFTEVDILILYFIQFVI